MTSDISVITSILDSLFPNPTMPLYHTNCYTLLIAVLLSAQCSDARVNLVTPALFAKADTPDKMLCLSVQEIEQMIASCGLSRKKSRAIWELSEILVKVHRGNVPSSMAELQSLPGVGRKTALVVLGNCFQKETFPVDTHIIRCAGRWDLTTQTHPLAVEKALCAVFPQSTWNKRHLQIIFYGRSFCTAKKHEITHCPICFQLRAS